MVAPEIYFENNAAKTLTLAAVYGEPSRLPIMEDEPLQPTNRYGKSKLMVERLPAWFDQIHGLRLSLPHRSTASLTVGCDKIGYVISGLA